MWLVGVFTNRLKYLLNAVPPIQWTGFLGIGQTAAAQGHCQEKL